MLPKHRRLNLSRGRPGAKKILVHWKKGAHIHIRYDKNNLLYNRYAVVIAQKILSKSSARNRLRRVLYETIQKNDVKYKKGFDVLIACTRLPAQIDKNTERMLKKEASILMDEFLLK